MTAIAGLFPTFTFQEETITPNQVPSVQNWTCFKPEAQLARRPRKRCGRSNREVQRNNREEKKGTAAIAFERERGYKKKAQRKRGSHAPRLGRGRRPGAWSARL